MLLKRGISIFLKYRFLLHWQPWTEKNRQHCGKNIHYQDFCLMSEEYVQAWITLYKATFERKVYVILSLFFFPPQVESIPINIRISEAMQAKPVPAHSPPSCLKGAWSLFREMLLPLPLGTEWWWRWALATA